MMDEVTPRAPAELATPEVREVTIEQYAIGEGIADAIVNHARHLFGDAACTPRAPAAFAELFNRVSKSRF